MVPLISQVRHLTLAVVQFLRGEPAREERRQVLPVQLGKAHNSRTRERHILLLRQLGQVLRIDRLSPFPSLGQGNRHLPLPPMATTTASLVLLASAQILQQRHCRPTETDRGEEDNDQSGRNDHVPRLVTLKVRVQREGVGNGAAQPREPHDELHLVADLVLPELVHHPGQRKDVAGASKQTQNHGPDDQRRLHLMLEGEDGQAEVAEDTGLGDEGEGAHRLLHRDLGDCGQVEVRVMGHDDAREQNGHDPAQVDALGQHVRGVGEGQHHAEL